MALVVEDGSGLADAEAYASVAEFKAYDGAWHDSRHNGKSDVEVERALRRASQFVDVQFLFAGNRSSATQAMEFPRAGLVDQGHAITGVPTRVKRATFELTHRALSEDLIPDIERANHVRSESVGSISVTYAENAPESKLFRIAERLVQPFVRKQGAEISMAPGGASAASAGGLSGATAAPYFTLGMHDVPDLGTGG